MAKKKDVNIFQDKIAWINIENFAQLYTCNMKKNGQQGGCLIKDKKIQVTNTTAFNIEPSIFLDTIVWGQSDGKDAEIMICNLKKNGQQGGCLIKDKKIQITNNKEHDTNPNIFRNFIAWETEKYTGNRDIIIYDLKKRKVIEKIEGKTDQWSPQIFYDNGRYFIIYSHQKSHIRDVKYKEIGKNKTHYLTTKDNVSEWNPSVSNFGSKKIMWQTSKNGYSSIEGLTNKGIVNIKLNNTKYHQHVAVFNDTIVFDVWKNDKWDIWAGYCK